jgi:H+-translocating NAD(P) transhydrogenase subunit alpha
MRIAVAREIEGGEPRVATTPETIKKLKSFGGDVAVARGAGAGSGIPDEEFAAADAEIGDGDSQGDVTRGFSKLIKN